MSTRIERNAMNDEKHPIPEGRDKDKKHKVARKQAQKETPKPNMQAWVVTYEEPRIVQHRFSLPVGEEPKVNENGWLECNGIATNTKHVSNVQIKKNGAAYYKATQRKVAEVEVNDQDC